MMFMSTMLQFMMMMVVMMLLMGLVLIMLMPHLRFYVERGSLRCSMIEHGLCRSDISTRAMRTRYVSGVGAMVEI